MLNKDPHKRPTIDDIMAMPYIKERLRALSKSKTTSLLRKRPGTRGSRTPRNRTPSRTSEKSVASNIELSPRSLTETIRLDEAPLAGQTKLMSPSHQSQGSFSSLEATLKRGEMPPHRRVGSGDSEQSRNESASSLLAEHHGSGVTLIADPLGLQQNNLPPVSEFSYPPAAQPSISAFPSSASPIERVGSGKSTKKSKRPVPALQYTPNMYQRARSGSVGNGWMANGEPEEELMTPRERLAKKKIMIREARERELRAALGGKCLVTMM